MKREIRGYVKKAIADLQKAEKWPRFDIPEVVINYPKDEKFGDYSTNAAMVLAGILGKKPMETADEIISNFPASPAGGQFPISNYFKEIKIAPPGYVNFYLSEKYLQGKVREINSNKEKYGNSKIGRGIKVNNEFISANPTGPLHLGNGRGGFYGDAISNILRKSGHKVVNEYYINDAGEQILKLGHSVLKDKDAVYSGDYIDELNKKLRAVKNTRSAGEKAANVIMREIIKKSIKEEMMINFDSWISEKKDLHEKKYVDKAIGILRRKKLTYKEDGALWLKTARFGDDKDRVLAKSSGEKTYFASDCGYILHKKKRGFKKLIEIWGADHHGYIKRFEAAAKALGFEGDLRFIIVQLVKLVERGREVRMSKRAGNVVYIDDLMKEIGHDVARFFFLMYAPDTHMNFDLGLAKERSEKNPVYYVQYAHARISSILRKSEIRNPKSENLNLLIHEKELSLIKELNKFPELIEEISQSYEVHKLPHYAMKLADKFHSFYDACRVIDEKNPGLTGARLMLVNAVRIVLAETLRLMGVSSPEKM